MGLQFKSFVSKAFEDSFKKLGENIVDTSKKIKFIRFKLKLESEKAIFLDLIKKLSSDYLKELEEAKTQEQKDDVKLTYMTKQIDLEALESELTAELDYSILKDSKLNANDEFVLIPIIHDFPI